MEWCWWEQVVVKGRKEESEEDMRVERLQFVEGDPPFGIASRQNQYFEKLENNPSHQVEVTKVCWTLA